MRRERCVEAYGRIRSLSRLGNGERRKERNSHPLPWTKDDRCLYVALDIETDQQPRMMALQGQSPVSEIYIQQTTDHLGYRDILEEFGSLVRGGRCLTVVATDAPRGYVGTRDEHMLGVL